MFNRQSVYQVGGQNDQKIYTTSSSELVTFHVVIAGYLTFFKFSCHPTGLLLQCHKDLLPLQKQLVVIYCHVLDGYYIVKI